MHVAVVGAGIIGLTAAVRLRAAGHAVTLIAPELDAAGRPHAVAGATHAAAGMLAPLAETQFSQDDLAPLLQAGWEAYPALVDLLAAFTDGYSTYAGGKAPVEHFTRAAAKEYADRGISVTAIGPGPMDTPFFYGQETPERVEFHKSQAMGNQLTKIEDIAPIVRFLATEGWWITGQTIFANGGYTTR